MSIDRNQLIHFFLLAITSSGDSSVFPFYLDVCVNPSNPPCKPLSTTALHPILLLLIISLFLNDLSPISLSLINPVPQLIIMVRRLPIQKLERVAKIAAAASFLALNEIWPSSFLLMEIIFLNISSHIIV